MLLVARSHVLLMLSMTWVSLLLSKLLVYHIELSTHFLHFISNHSVFNVIMSTVVNNLFIDFLFSIAVISFIILIIITTIVVAIFSLMLAVQSRTSLMIPHSIKSIMSSSGDLILVSLRIKQVVGNILFLIFVLITSDVLLDILLHARLDHVVLINTNVLTLTSYIIVRVLILIGLRSIIWVVILFLSSNIHLGLVAYSALINSMTPVTQAMCSSNILRLLLMLHLALSETVATALSSLILGSSISSLSALAWSLLLTRVKVVAEPVVIHARADNMRKSIVVPVYFYRISDDRLNSVVVTHHIYLLYHAVS